MFRSVRSQITAAVSLIILVVLGAAAYLVIDQKRGEISHDIYEKAFSFAELTHERVLSNYERNYRAQAFANFDREMATIAFLNTDVTGVEIFAVNGDVLYRPQPLFPAPLSDADYERLQAVIPSVRTEAGRVIYLERSDEGLRTADFNGVDVPALSDSEMVTDIVMPFRDPNNALRSYALRYQVSYEALNERIRSTAIRILALALLGIGVALVVGRILSGHITAPIRLLTDGATRIGRGALDTRVQVRSRNELGLLAETFNHMAEDLQKNTAALVEKEKLTHELELAGEIQRDLLPKILPRTPTLDIAASLISAEAVGGDCYDFIVLEDGRILFYVADVTGHGVPAGLLSAINNALVHAFSDRYGTTQELVVHLNRVLKLKMRPNVFMTMVMALWDEKASLVSFTQAGHEPLLVYRSASLGVEKLSPGGIALGMIPDVSKVSKTEKVALATGDVLVLYTDGIPEAWKNEKETYGMERFMDSLKRHSSLATAQEIHDALLADVRAFMGSYPQADDISLVVAKRV